MEKIEKINFSKLIVDKATLDSEGIGVGEFFYTILFLFGYPMKDLEEQLLEQGNAKFDHLLGVVPSKLSIAKARRVLLGQSAPVMDKDEMLVLAKKLKAMFPKGAMMDGIPWTEGPILIVQRLEGFFRRFGNYTSEEIEKAMQRYVDTMRGNPFMRSLKNAIFKETPQADGTVELQSDLYNSLENPESLANPLEDWTSELRE